MDQTDNISHRPSVPERILRLRERIEAEKPSQASSSRQVDPMVSDENMQQDKQALLEEIGEMQYEAWDEQFLIDRWRDWTQWEQWTQWSSH